MKAMNSRTYNLYSLEHCCSSMLEHCFSEHSHAVESWCSGSLEHECFSNCNKTIFECGVSA